METDATTSTDGHPAPATERRRRGPPQPAPAGPIRMPGPLGARATKLTVTVTARWVYSGDPETAPFCLAIPSVFARIAVDVR